MDKTDEWIEMVVASLRSAVLKSIGLVEVGNQKTVQSTDGKWRINCTDGSALLTNKETGVSIRFYLQSTRLEVHSE